jgi:uncharacterized protein YjbJ (UPF0337 family)
LIRRHGWNPGRRAPFIARAADVPPERGGRSMNWDQVKGKWKQFSGQAKQQWGKLTDDDLQQIDGHREELVGRVQERYGIARDEAEKQVKDWESRV